MGHSCCRAHLYGERAAGHRICPDSHRILQFLHGPGVTEYEACLCAPLHDQMHELWPDSGNDRARFEKEEVRGLGEHILAENLIDR